MALQLGTCKYNHIRDILANHGDQLHKAAAPSGAVRRMHTCAGRAITSETNENELKEHYDDEHDIGPTARVEVGRLGNGPAGAAWTGRRGGHEL